MALDAVENSNGKGYSIAVRSNGEQFSLLDSKHGSDPFTLKAATQQAGFNANNNQHSRKTVFILGSNAAAHYVARNAIPGIGDRRIPIDIYKTDNLAKTKSLQDKLARPEVRNQAFFEKLMINHGYHVLDHFDQRDGMLLDEHGDLRQDLQYSPDQLARYYTSKGVQVNVIDMADPSLPEEDRDVNHPKFVDKIANDQSIGYACNIRSMQILKPTTIAAFENKTMHGNPTRIINAHPGEVITYPGTNIAFWARKNGYHENVWTLHVIDQGIDTGDVLDQVSNILKKGKTLMQDMLGMAPHAGNMIAADNRLTYQGTPRQAIPQVNHQHYASKPANNYTFATHQEYEDAYQQGIRVVNPQKYIEALVLEYTGSLTSERSVALHRSLAQATLDHQKDYLNIYQAEYGTYPPEYDPNNPQDYFVTVPPPYQAPANQPPHNPNPGQP
ncbi:MAG: hypothetical protein ACLFR0_01400 [Alphaproteobacteria bacterium]